MQEKPITATCGAQFDENDELTTRDITRNLCWEMPFKCSICGSCFAEAEELRIHLLLHGGKKPFKCDLCGLCLARQSGWKDHLRTHTGEKPFNVTCVDYALR